VKIRKTVYGRAKNDAVRKGELIWTPELHADLVRGEPAELRSKTKITAEQVLAIGLPDLTETTLPGQDGAAPRKPLDEVEASLPPSMRLDVVTVIDHLLIDERERKNLHKLLAQLVANMKAVGVIDEHGKQVKGQMIKELQGMDGLFVYWELFTHQLGYEELRELIEMLVDHDAVQRIFDRRAEDVKREWCRNRLREARMENGQIAWEDVEAEWDRDHPYQPSVSEQHLAEFQALVPHPEIHGGKKQKRIWAVMEDEKVGFLEFVEREGLAHEEGNLFSYLVRCMNTARKLGEASELSELTDIAERIRDVLARVDPRLLDEKRHRS
jgi:hypothetical protein